MVSITFRTKYDHIHITDHLQCDSDLRCEKNFSVIVNSKVEINLNHIMYLNAPSCRLSSGIDDVISPDLN